MFIYNEILNYTLSSINNITSKPVKIVEFITNDKNHKPIRM